MKTILTATALILVLALPVLAGETLPAQAQRIWAPTGDLIGLQNHATATLIINDDHGDQAKAAEDWSILGDTFGYGLFGYHQTSDSSHQLTVRGDGGNVEGNGLAGNFGLWSSSPGKYSVRLLYSKHDHYYDRDSEMRNPSFPYPPPPPELPCTPHLDWRRGRLDLKWHLSSAFDVNFGLADMRRSGKKTSLLRGFPNRGDSPPGVQFQDMKQYEIYLGGTFQTGRFASELQLALRDSDNKRDYWDLHTYDDEQKTYRASLDAAYDVSDVTRLAAYGSLASLELKGNETWSTRDGRTDGTVESSVGLLAVQSRLGRKTNLQASARFEGLQKETQIDEAGSVLYAGNRDHTRQDYRLVLGNTSVPRTRMRLQYRFTTANMDDITTEGGLADDPAAARHQHQDEDRTSHNLDFRSRTNLSRAVKLKIGVNYRTLDVDQKVTGSWYGTLGDHERDRLNWTVALKTRPHPNVPVDLGYQGVDQTFKRTEGEVAETTWQANRFFLNVNWIANARFSMYGMFNYGREVYELTGVADPAAGFGAYEYDGETLRFVPGAVLHITNAVQLDGMWEGIRYENTGDVTNTLNPVKADHNRTLLRLRWQASDKLAATAAYRRNDFTENRWDNYIQDLWSFSVSGVF